MADFGIAAKIEVPKVDALGMVGKVNEVGQGLLQNKLLGNRVRSQVALGEAVTASTDQETGKTDWNKVLGKIAGSGDPGVSSSAPDVAKAARERQLQDLQLTQEQVKTSLTKMTAVGNWALSLLAGSKQSPLNKDAVIAKARTDLFDSGVLNQEDLPMAESVLSQLTDDPVQNALLMKRLYSQTHSTTEGLAAVYGAPQLVDTGASKIPVQIAPGTGETTVGDTSIANQLTPAQMAQTITVVDETTGQPRTTTLGALLGKPQGDPNAKINKGGVAGGLGAGEGEALTQAASAGVRQAQGWRDAADRAPSNKAALNNIRDNLKNFQPGPKANLTYAVNALATQLGVATPGMKDAAASQEEFNKLATQFINQQVGALGGTGTDSKLESARHGSPNDFMSREGILNVTSLMLGLEDATLAKNAAWQKWLDAGNKPDTAGKFQTLFNDHYNPRVFQAEYMNEKQQQAMLAAMTKKERERFQIDWTFAHKAGWIK